MSAKDVVGGFLAALTKGGPNVEDLPDSDPMKATGRAAGDLVTAMVGHLATEFPNPVVNALMKRVWHLIGSKTTPTVLAPVATASVAAIRVADGVKFVILIPFEWPMLVDSDPTMAFGALVFCGSQALDHYNDRLVGQQDEAVARARTHEAEFLSTLRAMAGGWTPNEYQRKVLDTYPQGTRTPSVAGLLYQSKPVPNSPAPWGLAPGG